MVSLLRPLSARSPTHPPFSRYSKTQTVLQSSSLFKRIFPKKYRLNYVKPLPYVVLQSTPRTLSTLIPCLQSLGGRVEVKVPRQGFLLVQPQTSEQERLHQCWMSMDRPDRFMVPYTYVEACKIAGMLLRQIFMENGSPIPMHIHPSIANPNARSALASRILVRCYSLSRFVKLFLMVF